MEHTNYDQACRSIGAKVVATVISKHHDYGPKNILNCPVGPERGLLVRLHDKLARLANLLETGAAPNNESLVDSWMDIAGYAIIGLMLADGSFELPLDQSPDQSSFSTHPAARSFKEQWLTDRDGYWYTKD